MRKPYSTKGETAVDLIRMALQFGGTVIVRTDDGGRYKITVEEL